MTRSILAGAICFGILVFANFLPVLSQENNQEPVAVNGQSGHNMTTTDVGDQIHRIQLADHEKSKTDTSTSTSHGATSSSESSSGLTWMRSFGPSQLMSISSVVQTSEGDYAFAGVINYTIGFGVWVVKLSGSGDVLWQKNITAPSATIGYQPDALVASTDGGIVLAGQTFTGFTGSWVVKLDQSGNMVWDTYRTSPFLQANAILATHDGGYVVAGTVAVPSSDNLMAGWLLRLDSNGHELWQGLYNANTLINLRSVDETPTGDLVVAGTTKAMSRSLIMKLDKTGNILWQETFVENDSFHQALSVKSTPDGGIIVTGSLSESRPLFHAWVFRADSSGKMLWQKTYTGGREDDWGLRLDANSDGTYVLDMYDSGANPVSVIVKIDPKNGDVLWQRAIGEVAARSTVDGGYIAIGVDNAPYRSHGMKMWIAKLDNKGLCCARHIANGTSAKLITNTPDMTLTPSSLHPSSNTVPFATLKFVLATAHISTAKICSAHPTTQ